MMEISTLNGAKIVATDIVLSTVDCDEPCNVTVTVKWKNIGNSPAKFRPAITVNGVKSELGTEITLAKNQITTQIFHLTNLMEGTYTICPFPNDSGS